MSAVHPGAPPRPGRRFARQATVLTGTVRESRVPYPLQGAVAVIVPAYNTAPALPAVVRSLVHETAGVVAEVVVIDNASTDGTPDVVRLLMAEDPTIGAMVRVLQNPVNLGYGGSIKRGFAELMGTSPFVAVVHSDQQCDAAATLVDLAAAFALEPEPDVVLASRFRTGAQTDGYSLARRLANHFFNAFTRFLSGLRMSDAGTGIMLARSSALAQMPFDELTSGYQFHPQLNLIIYGDPDLVVAEVPLCWRDATVGVRFSLTGYALVLTRMLLAFAWHRRVRRRPIGEAVVAASRGAGA
ncbi:MAG TPA: glycosyltransferase family 2 protein [Baekduia sp.]|uniref:glycosyltransferase family 2 protein n=1 Tax=Baekduia sp. TaxID=2600305 RepID=UPI002BA0DD1A|nr:glycosyltransferase family 2 protein [Baekduia sp.]HMJ33194.1 glycosyltransferase family 2 protein [Baekduia sp.]